MPPALPSSGKRPSPDALLRQARREERGRLKIFLGAAPGVGKTFAMLTEGAALQREGVDAVVAVAETHGRAETEALLDGMEVVPRREIEYRGPIGRPAWRERVWKYGSIT